MTTDAWPTCGKGHPLDLENRIERTDRPGQYRCRACKTEARRAHDATYYQSPINRARKAAYQRGWRADRNRVLGTEQP